MISIFFISFTNRFSLNIFNINTDWCTWNGMQVKYWLTHLGYTANSQCTRVRYNPLPRVWLTFGYAIYSHPHQSRDANEQNWEYPGVTSSGLFLFNNYAVVIACNVFNTDSVGWYNPAPLALLLRAVSIISDKQALYQTTKHLGLETQVAFLHIYIY